MALGPHGYTSYHNHPGFDDGSGTVAEFAEAAMTYNLAGFGLSCHAPVPFASSWTMPLARLPEYVAEVQRIRTVYRDLVPLALGLELDYLHPDIAPQGMAWQERELFTQPLDYLVVSLHFVGFDPDGKPWAVDESAASFERQLTEVYGGSIQRLMTDYVDRIIALAAVAPSWGLPAIVGHIDKAKMWNIEGRYFAESAAWYRDGMDAALAAVADAGLVVELNTAGFGRPHGEPYPGRWVLERCQAHNIRVTVNADAHLPARIAREFDQAAALLRSVGYREIVALDRGVWVTRPLPG